MRQLRDTVNSIETKWQLDVAVIVVIVIVIVVIVIVIVVVLNYAKIDPRIRPSPSADHHTQDDTADDRSQHSADHRFAMMIMLPRGQRGAASTPGPGTDCN